MPQGTIILSDLHLTKHFDEAKYNLLVDILQKAQRVIINGDLWDGYLITFDDFMNSSWRYLFPILKAKETIYVYGNHDRKDYVDDRVYDFCVHYSHEFIFTYSGTTYVVRHGNEIKSFHDGTLPRPILKIGTMLNHLVLDLVVGLAGVYGYKWVFWDKNSLYKKWAKENIRKGEVFVTSHTHFPEIDLTSRVVNTGYGMHGYITYLELDQGTVKQKIRQW